MEITEVRIFPTESRDGKLKAFATMTFDDWFVVRNVKVIQGNSGLFVAMPSRKAMDSCRKCGFKNARGSKFCNDCGDKLPFNAENNEEAFGKKKSIHMDIAHPVTQDCRMYIQDKVLETFKKEEEKKQVQGAAYKPATEEDLDAASETLIEGSKEEKQPAKESSMQSETDDKDIAL